MAERRFLLNEQDIPTHWYNIAAADLPTLPPPPLHPGTGQPVGPDDLSPLFPMALIAQEEARWPLAGDNLIVDLDLSADNLPPGTRLAIGSALLEITEVPHKGCGKFAARFGVDATRFVNSREGLRLHLRGIYARIVERGTGFSSTGTIGAPVSRSSTKSCPVFVAWSTASRARPPYCTVTSDGGDALS